MKCKLALYSVVTLSFFLSPLFVSAQNKQADFLKIIPAFQQGAFPVVRDNRATAIFIDTADAAVVRIAGHAVASDIELITAVKPSVVSRMISGSPYLIIAGTIGQSSTIDELIKTKKLDVSKIKNKWESFTVTT